MTFKFKKFLVSFALGSVLIVGSSCLNVCYAIDPKVGDESEQTVAAEKDLNPDTLENEENSKLDTLARVLIEYRKMLESDLKYDPAQLSSNNGLDLHEAFYKDCKFVETEKKGVCKHFTNYLIKKLRDNGVEAYPLYIKRKDSSHCAVLYRAGDWNFVADVTSDIIAVQEGDNSRKEKPWFFADEIGVYIKYERTEQNAINICYIDADLTDLNIPLTSVEDVAQRIRILYDGE